MGDGGQLNMRAFGDHNKQLQRNKTTKTKTNTATWAQVATVGKLVGGEYSGHHVILQNMGLFLRWYLCFVSTSVNLPQKKPQTNTVIGGMTFNQHSNEQIQKQRIT